MYLKWYYFFISVQSALSVHIPIMYSYSVTPLTCCDKKESTFNLIHSKGFFSPTKLFKAFQKPLNLMKTLLFPQVSSLHLMQVSIILPSSIMLEKNVNQGCHWWRMPTLLSPHLMTIQAVTQLIMQEMQHSCSCRQGTRCLCACLQILVFGHLAAPPPSVVFWSVKCENSMTPEGWFQIPEINDASTILPLKFKFRLKQMPRQIKSIIKTWIHWVLTVSFAI